MRTIHYVSYGFPGNQLGLTSGISNLFKGHKTTSAASRGPKDYAAGVEEKWTAFDWHPG